MLDNFLKSKDIVFWNLYRDNVNGHIFECLDYYNLFKSNGFNVGIVYIYNELTKEDIRVLVEDKYNFTNDEINDIINDIYMERIVEFNARRIVNGSNVKFNIFTEAHDLPRLYNYTRHSAYAINNIIGLRCGKEEEAFEKLSKTTNLDLLIFQDFRIYGEDFFWDTIDHKKRILFSRYKELNKENKNRGLIYSSTRVRGTTSEYLKKVIDSYPWIEKFYITVMNPTRYSLDDERVEFIVPPVYNLFEKFDTLIYIPLNKKFDCSPRLITECTFYDKKIIFHDTSQRYQQSDKGLYWRTQDCLHNFDDLMLTKEDELYQYVISK